MFIYKITHQPSKRFYIGRTVQKLKYRFQQHKRKSCNYILRSLLEKYPIEEFIFKKIDEVIGDKSKENQNKLINLEQFYLNKYFDDPACLNFDKNARPLYSEDFVNRAKQKRLREERINKLSKIDAYVSYENKCDKPKGIYKRKIEDLEENRKQIIAEGKKFHKTKSKEQEQKRRDNLRKAMVAKLKPIQMFTINGKHVGTYESKRAIIRRHPELHRHCISNVLKGKANQHKGFIFKYELK